MFSLSTALPGVYTQLLWTASDVSKYCLMDSLSATTRFPSRIVMLTSAEDDTCPEPGLVFLAFFSLF